MKAGDAYSEEELKKLGARIKSVRKSKGSKNYEKFAFENGLSRSQLWRYEHGEDLNYSTLRKIIRALGITLAEFFSEGFE